MPAKVLIILLFSMVSGTGAIQVIGTLLGWRWFVDPPEEWAPMWPFPEMKRLLGRTGLLVHNYLIGSITLGGSITILILLMRGGQRATDGMEVARDVVETNYTQPLVEMLRHEDSRTLLLTSMLIVLLANVAIWVIRQLRGKASPNEARANALLLLFGLLQLVVLMLFAGMGR